VICRVPGQHWLKIPPHASVSPSPEKITVYHNRLEHRFEATVEGRLAVCEYESDARGWTFTHTFVPPELRGRGIAELLVRAALDVARAEGQGIVPACSYVAAFVERHSEYKPLVL